MSIKFMLLLVAALAGSTFATAHVMSRHFPDAGSCREVVLNQMRDEAAFRRALRSAAAEADADDFLMEIQKGAKK